MRSKACSVDFVGGLEMGAVPIATAVAIASHRRGGNLQAFFVRKKPKDHGAKKLVEGLPKGETPARARTSSWWRT